MREASATLGRPAQCEQLVSKPDAKSRPDGHDVGGRCKSNPPDEAKLSMGRMPPEAELEGGGQRGRMLTGDFVVLKGVVALVATARVL